MKKISEKRKLRYGTVSLLLCILVAVCVVIINVIAASLSLRYDGMYIEMNKPRVYDISDACHDYIEEHIIPEVDASRNAGGDREITVIFCDGGTENSSEQLYKYIYDSVDEICERFRGYFKIEHLNIWDEPSRAKEYSVDSTEDVVCLFNGRSQTVDLKDFYLFETVETQAVPVAYNGEKLLASCLMMVTQGSTPTCYLTVNHGEIYGDYAFVRMISEAGYKVDYLDLYNDDIPEDCGLIVTFNPNKDFAAANETSSVSEVEKLDEYMSNGGKYMVFLSSSTFSSGGFENLEGFLSDWGIRYMHETADGGIEACRLVKDNASSLTVDGYTVLSDVADSGIATSLFGSSSAQVSFGNTTYMSAAQGFAVQGSSYISADGKRVMSPLFTSRDSAVAYLDGRAVARASESDFILMSLTEEKLDGGKTAQLLASASVDFASEDAMDSAVLGNSRALSEALKYMGKENTPSRLVFKPFGETEIASLTTSAANIMTVCLVVLPAVAVTAFGVIVLVRRKNR